MCEKCEMREKIRAAMEKAMKDGRSWAAIDARGENATHVYVYTKNGEHLISVKILPGERKEAAYERAAKMAQEILSRREEEGNNNV